MEMERLVKEIKNNADFKKKIDAINSAEELVAVAKENGIDVSVEDVNKLRLILSCTKEDMLSDAALDEVVGGSAASDVDEFFRGFFLGFFKPFSSLDAVINDKDIDLPTWGEIGDLIVSKIPFV